MSAYCIFSALYAPSMGGVERFTQSLALELAQRGHHIVVVTNDTGNVGPYELLDAFGETIGVDLEKSKDSHLENLHGGCIEVLRFPCISLLGGRYPVPIKNSLFNTLISKLDAVEFAGVLVNTRFYIHSLIGTSFALRHGIRPVVLDHGSAYLTLGSAPLDFVIARYEDAITAVLKRRDVDFYGVSQRSCDWLRHFGLKPKGVISNSIDARTYRDQASDRDYRRELHIPHEDLLVAFVGRLVPEKGISVLLDAFTLLQANSAVSIPETGCSNVSLVVAGAGTLCSQVESCRLRNVYFVGRLASPDVAALMLQADVFCLPTRSEGFSTSLLESAACGTPSIVTNVGGAAELIPDDSCGHILSDADPCELANVLEHYSCNRSEVARMGERVYERVCSEYSWASTADCLLDAFKVAALR